MIKGKKFCDYECENATLSNDEKQGETQRESDIHNNKRLHLSLKNEFSLELQWE